MCICQIIYAGFKGFNKVKKLWIDNSVIPKNKGIYTVQNQNGIKPRFLFLGVVGYLR